MAGGPPYQLWHDANDRTNESGKPASEHDCIAGEQAVRHANAASSWGWDVANVASSWGWDVARGGIIIPGPVVEVPEDLSQA